MLSDAAAASVLGTMLWQSHSSSVILVFCPMPLVHAVLPCSTCSVGSLLFQDSPDSLLLILKPLSNGHPHLWIPGPSSPDLWLEAAEQITRPFKVSQSAAGRWDAHPLPWVSCPGVLHPHFLGSQLTCWVAAFLPNLMIETLLKHFLISIAGCHPDAVFPLCRSWLSF